MIPEMRPGPRIGELVADLYRRHRTAANERRTVARYAAAYAKIPSTEAEDYLTERSTEMLFDKHLPCPH
jgi:hypothetical protein